MTRLVGSLSAAVAFATLSSAGIVGQAQTTTSKPAASGAAGTRAPAAQYVSKRLPWGDPDISGNFTTKDEANTPL